ncbi:hypothetical protein Z950_1970 [Sulfitobacter mediterraneus KCTC 32188]|nr:hypothetical protein Z950_1970 [Sulfitobacter mediterraneus KCTC 32188]
MNFAVADVVHQDHRPAFAALELGDQMMLTLSHIGRDGPMAQRALRVVHVQNP